MRQSNRPWSFAPRPRGRECLGFPDMTRTTRNHAGEALEDGYNTPGIVLCALAVVACALALTAAGYGFVGWAVIAGGAFLFCAVTGIGWLLLEHRHVKAEQGLRLWDQRGH